MDVETWRERMRRFAEMEARGSSPLYEVLAGGVAEDDESLGWLAADAGPRANPNLLFAAVHDLLLRGEDAGGLGRYYASVDPDPVPSDAAYSAFQRFCTEHRSALGQMLASRTTQTNEVGRCAYLLPALVIAAEEAKRPLFLVDVGTAAGVNLLFDRYHYDYGDGLVAGAEDAAVRLSTEVRGARPTVAPFPAIAGRVGIDLSPVDASDPGETRWLEACVWPEHLDRLASLRGALAEVRRIRPTIVAGNAVDVLNQVASGAPAEALAVIVNTNVLPYFSAEERTRFGEIIARLGAARDIAWIAAEAAPLLTAAGFAASFEGVPRVPAAVPLVMSTFGGGVRDDRVLALTGPHARWLEWYGADR